MSDLKALYEDDTVAWAENQAAALRAAARGTSDQPLDWENLAEEIEDLSKSIKRGVHSHIRNIIEHLIKLEYSPQIGLVAVGSTALSMQGLRLMPL